MKITKNDYEEIHNELTSAMLLYYSKCCGEFFTLSTNGDGEFNHFICPICGAYNNESPIVEDVDEIIDDE